LAAIISSVPWSGIQGQVWDLVITEGVADAFLSAL